MLNEWLYQWNYESLLTNYEMYLFYYAMRNQINNEYQPIAIAKHSDFKERFRFLSIAKPKSSTDLRAHFAYIEVYKPVNAMPYVTKIHRIDFDSIY